MSLAGAAGILAPGVVLGAAAHSSYGDVRYSAYVFGLMAGVHSVVWLALAGLMWRRLGRRFVAAVSLGSWLALAAAAAAVTGIDHPYVYLVVYVIVSAAVTLIAGAFACRRV